MRNNSFRRLIRNYPAARGLLRRAYRSGLYISARFISRLRHDDLYLINVDPMRVQMTVNKNDFTLTGNAMWHVGSVAHGDWDLGGVTVSEHGDIAAILNQHVGDRRPLFAIPQYQSNVRRIEQGELIDSCTTPDEYKNRWHQIAELYATIRDHGYKTQIELGSDNPLDEIRVQIGRCGDFLFEEGLHRLVIAQMLELGEVPMLVTRRHADWAALRDAVLRIVLQRGFIHQPFDHPDLDSLPLHYGNELAEKAMYAHDRWDFIQQSLPVKAGSLLDIGAYFGYFTHRFERIGFNCYAVEPDRDNLKVLNLYRAMQNYEFTVWPETIFEIERNEFDVVLALNVFHHLVRSREDYRRLVTFLRNLKCQAMYFEPDDNAGIDAYRHFGDAEFVAFVRANTGLKQVRYLGQAKEGRGVYLLSSS